MVQRSTGRRPWTACCLAVVALCCRSTTPCFVLGGLESRWLPGRCGSPSRGSAVALQGCRIAIHMVSKPDQGGWEAAAVTEYAQRMRVGDPPMEVETIFHKSD
ncbi:unnamed protein product, partial [Polarella glacialis]